MKYQLPLLIVLTLVACQQSSAQNTLPCGPDWMPPRLKKLVRQDFEGADFRPACRTHDRCYEMLGANRLECDNAFRDRVSQACLNSSNPEKCQRLNERMYRSVRMFGGGSFRVWQRKAVRAAAGS